MNKEPGVDDNRSTTPALTDEDDEAMVLLREALVQLHLLVRGGQAGAAGGAGGAGLAPPPAGRPPPQTETPAVTSWSQKQELSCPSALLCDWPRLVWACLTQVDPLCDVTVVHV